MAYQSGKIPQDFIQMEPTNLAQTIHDSELQTRHNRTLKYVRICAVIIASTEMILGALSLASNLGIFTYYLVEASSGTPATKPDFFFERIIEVDVPISAWSILWQRYFFSKELKHLVMKNADGHLYSTFACGLLGSL
ncbi:hypothetical protein Ocin01_00733 [Orchesella cincta]|uniref:Uncharacterized protein n=1 Tax=Orchesella cincta TaxID=48709 RepID=A0A1D2NL11_ORCCI|nr:hypothetical protein Ocin01_00733 [Orchesella cincta]